MHLPINMSGVEDNVENWLHVVQLWCSSPMKSIFFSFCHSYSFCLMISMLTNDFTHIFSLRILLMAVENRTAIRSQARQIAVTDPM